MRKIVTPWTQVQTGFFFWELEHPVSGMPLLFYFLECFGGSAQPLLAEVTAAVVDDY